MCHVLDAIDCGIKVLKCCNTPKCRKLGTTKTFLSVLILLAIVQGISEKFIAISAQQAALEHDFNSDVIGRFWRNLKILQLNNSPSWLFIF